MGWDFNKKFDGYGKIWVLKGGEKTNLREILMILCWIFLMIFTGYMIFTTNSILIMLLTALFANIIFLASLSFFYFSWKKR